MFRIQKFRIENRAIRTVLGWQLLATAAATLLAGLLAGLHGALSAVLGGAVSLCAGLAFAVMVSRNKSGSVEGVLIAALRAEAVKIGVIVLLLWLVFATYKDMIAVAFLGTFMLTVVIFAMAFFVRDPQ